MPKGKLIVVANWKCNPRDPEEAKSLFASQKKLGSLEKIEVVICPPLVYLPKMKATGGIKLGAQDCFWEEKGSFTGEVSAVMLRESGCEYVIVGHSERRRHFGETEEMINKKLKASLGAGLKTILCVGETGEERVKQKTKEILKKQLEGALRDVSEIDFPISHLLIAYEPVWAIGTGNACNPDMAQASLFLLQEILREILGVHEKEIIFLYGGSVEAKNAKNYIDFGFSGLLVGGASLKPEEFKQIVMNLA
jgi:triosephosphate isomerase